MLPDIAHAPRILPNFTQHIPAAFKKVITTTHIGFLEFTCMHRVLHNPCTRWAQGVPNMEVNIQRHLPTTVNFTICSTFTYIEMVDCPTYTATHTAKSCACTLHILIYCVCHNYASAYVTLHYYFLQDLDNYIRTRAPVTFLQELRGHLTVRLQTILCCISSVYVCTVDREVYMLLV